MGQAAGSMALSMGGKLIGGAIGGPVGGMIGGLAGGIIASLVFKRSQKPIIPDYQLANSSYGHPIPIIYGEIRLPATVIWETEIVVGSHTVSGGKGIGGTPVNTFKQSAAFAFCEGPAHPIKLWLDGKLFYDTTATVPQEYTKYKFPIRVYTGTEDQMPDPLVQSWVMQKVMPYNSTPAYRGLCYLLFQEIDLSHYGNRMPNVTAIWATNAAESLIVKKLNYWTDDTDVSQFVPSSNAIVSVDWPRMACYTLTYLGVVRTFDMRGGLCLNKVDVVDLMIRAGFGTIFGDQTYSTGVWPFGAIAAEPGGDVYISNIPHLHISGFSFHWDRVYIFRLDAGLSEVISEIQLPAQFLVNNYIDNLKVFDLVGALGVYVMAAGTFVIGAPFLVDPEFGYFEQLPVADGSIFGTSWFLIGKKDQLQGTVDVWFFNASALNQNLEIYKAFVQGNDISQIVEMGLFTHEATITPADYGVTPSGIYNARGTRGIYDATDDTIVLSDFLLGATLKWSPVVGVVWTQPRYTIEANHYQNYVDTDAGRFASAWINTTRTIWVDETFTGTEPSVYNFTQVIAGGGPPAGTASATFGYDSALNGILFSSIERSNSQLYVAYLQRFTGGKVRVADIIADLCTRVGMTSDMFDVSLVEDLTWGYMVNDQKSAGLAVLDLCHTFMIDMVESDYVLRFVPRGTGSIATIPQQDLASADSNEPGRFWEAKRAQEQELPLQINVRYNDPSLDFLAGASYAKRIALPVPTTFSKRVKTVDLPIVAENAEARHIAEKWLYTMWAERDTYHTKFGWKYLFLDPTDNVTVNLDNGDSYTLRIESTEVGADYTMDVHMASEDITTYAVSTSPGASVSFTPQTLKPAAFVELLQFNSPLLQDSDDLGGLQSRIYYAAAPTATVDPSSTATLFQSADRNTWTQLNVASAYANWGRASSALPDTPAKFATDYLNSVLVTMTQGSTTPASCSYTDMMNGVNAAILGSEIIQFQNVVTNDDGSLTLSTIVRGRRGTDWATGTHHSGELFILLEAGEVVGTRLPLTQLGVTEFYRLVPLNTVLSAVPTDAFVYRGYDLMPYAPNSFKRANSGSDLLLTWHRRTRIGGLLIDGSDSPPLGEATENYEIYLMLTSTAIDSFDPDTPASYTRKLTAVTTSVTYTAAMMTTDGFTRATDTLYMVVYQLSTVVGRGFQGYQPLPAF
jgi:putative tail protein